MPTLRAAALLTVFVLVTLLLIPVQWALLHTWPRAAREFPHRYHRFVAALFGIRIRVTGALAHDGGVLLLANHTGWLDIVIFSAVAPISFVAKSEVGAWPFFGTLARLQRTVFVTRDARASTKSARDAIAARLAAGDIMVLFPEGTSGDGNCVLPFKSALLGAVEGVGVVQPVSVAYVGQHGLPMGRENRPLYAWYGDMELVPHLWEALKAGPLDVTVQFHSPLETTDRKEMAVQAQAIVRRGQIEALAGNI
jgi:1-acyl-sn-glycerol-3-phosphate acyltransferase